MIVGIDPSVTKTAVAWTAGRDNPQTRLFTSPSIGTDQVAKRMGRYENCIARLYAHLRELDPKVIFIEGYSFGSKAHQAEKIAEFGGLLRWHLVSLTEHVYEVAPSTLKKFVTGKGIGDKGLIMAHIAQRWNTMLPNNDEADAYGLCRLGMAACGMVDMDTKAQVEAVTKAVGADAAMLRDLLAGHTIPF